MALTQLGNVREAIGRFNTNQSSYTDEEQRNLLKLALHYGTAYEPEAKPISKGLYNFANIASFGLMPESWRPHSIGQDYYGERGIDKFASGVGAVGGLVAAPFSLLGGARAGMAGLSAAGRGARYAGGRLATRFPRAAGAAERAAGAAERGVGRARAGGESLRNVAREARDTGVLAKDYIITSSPVQAIRTRLSEARLNNIATKLKNTGIAGEEGAIMGTARQAARGLEGLASAGGRAYGRVAPAVGRGIGRVASSMYPKNWNIGGGFSGYNIPY